MTNPLRILFVCSGNICRSPTAEGVLRALAARDGLDGRLEIESAGTHDFHAGEPPDRRAQTAARTRGYDLSDQRARKIRREDFDRFDLVIALDEGHLRQLRQLCPPGREHRIALFTDFAAAARGRGVPDPYYGDSDGFERVLDLIEDSAAGLLAHLRESRLGT